MKLYTFNLGMLRQWLPPKIFLIMRLIIIMMVTCLMQVSAASFAQRLTYVKKDATLAEIFTEIKKQTGYNVLYSNQKLDDSKIVIANFNSTPIVDVLNSIIKNEPLIYEIDEKTILIKEKSPSFLDRLFRDDDPAFADIRGVVRNERGEALEGITVMVKGSKTGTKTNEKGEFLLKGVKKGDVLVFTGVAIEPFEYTVKDDKNVDLNLKARLVQLEEVNVEYSTGYQKIPKERATGSFVQIDKATLNLQTGTNILKRLEGVTSGLLFDNNKVRGGLAGVSNDNISIRGVSTINSSMDPLIILDGFIYEGKIENINPNDIENVTVLKDAAATSIWGAKAGNGVIVISTISGKLNQKLNIGASINTIISDKPNLFSLPQMTPNDYIEVEQFLFSKGFFDSRTSIPYMPITPAVDIFNKRKLGQISSQDSAKLIDNLAKTDTRNEYLKYLYTTPITQQYNINLRGGSSNNAYSLSVSYDDVRSNLKEKSNKLNVRFGNTFQPTNWLKIQGDVYYTTGVGKSGAPPYGHLNIAGRIAPYYSLFGENGEAFPVALDFNPTYIDAFTSAKNLLDWKYYPGTDYLHDVTTGKTHDVFVNGGIQAKIASWLHLDVKGQYQRQQIESTTLHDMESYFTRNLINSFTQIDNASGTIKYIIPKGAIKSLFNNQLTSSTGRVQLNIDKQWTKHNLNGIIGSEIRDARSQNNQYTIYGYNEDPLRSISVDFVNTYPHLIYGYSQGISGNPVQGENVNRFVSMYGNLSYNFDKRYTFSGSLRRDGSNLFGVKTNDRWKPLWSVGGMWNISNEHFYHSQIIPHLALRATYGVSGNVDLRMTAVPIGTYSVSSVSNLPAARVQTLNNPLLRWEKSAMLNIGVDFILRNSILSGSVEYYYKNNTDLYGNTLYDYTSWGYVNEVTINSASMIGRGVDVALTGKWIDAKIKWQTNLLFNYNMNKITKYSSANALLYSKINASTANLPVVGRPLYSAVAFKWGGLDGEGNPQGYVNGKLSTKYAEIMNEANLNGESGNLKYIGPTTPSHFGSLGNTVSYKNITLTALISYKFGYHFAKPALSYSNLINNGLGTKDYEKRWKKAGDENHTNVPVFLPEISQNTLERDFFYTSSEAVILKGDNIRLQFVNLSYSFGNLINKKSSGQAFQVYLNASNLGLVWRANKESIDPDYPSSIYPPSTYTIGLRVNL